MSPPPCIPYWRRQTLNEHQCGLLRGRNSLRSVDPDPPPVLSPDPTLGAALLRTWPSRLLSRQPTSNCVCMPVLGMAPKVFARTPEYAAVLTAVASMPNTPRPAQCLRGLCAGEAVGGALAELSQCCRSCRQWVCCATGPGYAAASCTLASCS